MTSLLNYFMNEIFNLSIDFYLTSSEDFGRQMKELESKRILRALESDNETGFNERLIKVICINQAILKMQKELNSLKYAKEEIV